MGNQEIPIKFYYRSLFGQKKLYQGVILRPDPKNVTLQIYLSKFFFYEKKNENDFNLRNLFQVIKTTISPPLTRFQIWRMPFPLLIEIFPRIILNYVGESEWIDSFVKRYFPEIENCNSKD